MQKCRSGGEDELARRARYYLETEQQGMLNKYIITKMLHTVHTRFFRFCEGCILFLRCSSATLRPRDGTQRPLQRTTNRSQHCLHFLRAL